MCFAHTQQSKKFTPMLALLAAHTSLSALYSHLVHSDETVCKLQIKTWLLHRG